ncbi:MAG: hypothetical protein AB1410_10800 [Acidobacteriota bacterium]
MKTRDIIIVILVILFGIGLHFVKNYDFKGIEIDDFFKTRGIPFEFKEEKELVLEPPSYIKILNKYGYVKFIGKDTNKLRAQITKKIWAKNRREADLINKKVSLVIDKFNNRIDISVNRDEISKRKRKIEIYMDLEGPKSSDLFIGASYCEISAEKIDGNVEVENKYGKIEARNIGKNLSIKNSYGNIETYDIVGDLDIETKYSKISSDKISGNVKIYNKYGEIDVKNVLKSVLIKSDYSGIEAENIIENLSIGNSYKDIRLKNAGKVEIRTKHSSVIAKDVRKGFVIEGDYCSLDAENMKGDFILFGKHTKLYGNEIEAGFIDISTNYEDVYLANFSGKVKINLRNGSIFLKPVTINDEIEVDSEYSNIELSLPKKSMVYLISRARGGDIISDFQFPKFTSRIEGTEKVFIAGDEKDIRISLKTSYGNIKIY